MSLTPKQIITISSLVLGLIILTSLFEVEKVQAGEVGVKVNLLGSKKGVDSEVLTPGRYILTWNEELYRFPTSRQEPKYTKASDDDAGREVDWQTGFGEGYTVDSDFSVTYEIQNHDVSKVFQQYRQGTIAGGIDYINKEPMRNLLRKAMNEIGAKYKFEQLYGEDKTKMMNEVDALVKARAKDMGITVISVNMLSSVRPPPEVAKAMTAKMEATQRAQQRENELREAQAQAAKEVASAQGAALVAKAEAEGKAAAIVAVAEAQAKANKLKNESLTDKIIEYEKAQKWDGKLPTVVGSNGNQFFTVAK